MLTRAVSTLPPPAAAHRCGAPGVGRVFGVRARRYSLLPLVLTSAGKIRRYLMLQHLSRTPGVNALLTLEDRLERVEHRRVLDGRRHRLVAPVGDAPHGLAE